MTTKNNKNYDIQNGITITDSISLTINSQDGFLPKLLLILTALAGVMGFVFSFLTLFNFNYNLKPVLLSIFSMFAICSLVFMFPTKAKLMLVPVYILLGYGAYRHKENLIYGYSDFINTIAADINITGKNHEYYSIPPEVDISQCVTLFFVFLFAVTTSIICYNTIMKPRFILAFSSTFPFIETGLYFGLAPSHLPFFLLIAYWIAVFAMRVAGNQFHSTSGQPVFVRKRNVFVSSGNLKNNVIESIGIIILISVFSVFVISSAILKIISYERSDNINDTRHNLKTAISEMSFEKLIHSFSEKMDSVPITNKSKLGNISSIKFDHKTDITVMLSDSVSSNLYIKGFTGSLYKDNSWYIMPDSTISDNSSLFDSFSQNDLYPQNFNSINNRNISSIYPEEYKRYHMIVKSLFKTNSYLFAPYGVVMNNMTSSDDAFLQADNMNDYSFSFYNIPDSRTEFSHITDNIDIFSRDSLFSTIENSYRSFVYQNYLDLPDNNGIRYLRDNYPQIPKYDGTNIEEISTVIRELLSNSAEYSLNPGRTPGNKDLAYYLIAENHKGYCSHFATAAIVLARISGIPARYAEGYVVVPSDFDTAERIDTYYKINITDSRAHAWAEFYIDGYGWLPFEFTPGYASGIISAEAQSTETTLTEVPQTAPAESATSLSVSTQISHESTIPAVSNVPQTYAGSASSTAAQGGSSGTHEDKGTSTFSVIITFVAMLIIMAFIAFVAIFARHIVYTRKRILSFRTKSINKNITNVYQYVLKLLEYNDISDRSLLPLEFAQYAEENIGELADSGDMTNLISITLKSSFSEEIATRDELNEVIKIAHKIAEKTYKSKAGYEKIRLKYILNLIN